MFDHFERMIDDHNSNTMVATNFLPYNIVKTGDYTYDVELALAGFPKDDIDVEYKDNMLIMSNPRKNPKDDDVDGMFIEASVRDGFQKPLLLLMM